MITSHVEVVLLFTVLKCIRQQFIHDFECKYLLIKFLLVQILCLHGSPDGPGQYVTFSFQ